MWCDQGKSIGSRKCWFYDRAEQSRKCILFPIVFGILQLLISLEPIDQFQWGFCKWSFENGANSKLEKLKMNLTNFRLILLNHTTYYILAIDDAHFWWLGGSVSFLLGQNFVLRTRLVFFTHEPAFLTDLVKIPVVPWSGTSSVSSVPGSSYYWASLCLHKWSYYDDPTTKDRPTFGRWVASLFSSIHKDHGDRMIGFRVRLRRVWALSSSRVF